MKKLISLITALLVLVSAFAGCSRTNSSQAGSGQTKKVKIGIVQPMEHPSLNTIRETIISELNAELGKDNVEIIYKNAQSDPTAVNTIISQFIGDNVDYIVPIATAPAQAAAAATKTIPIVFAAVSYPVEAGLVPSMDYKGGNVTGVSNAIAIEQVFDLARVLTPNVKTYGLIYNSGEVNSVSGIQRAKAYCDKNGIKYVETTIAGSSELLQATQSLIAKKVDAIFTPNDNTVASAMPTLAAEAIKAKIPVYVGADSMVKDGGLATVGIDYTILGKQVAQMLSRLIGGQTVAQNPVEVVNQYAKMINTKTAASIGLTIPSDKLPDFKVIE